MPSIQEKVAVVTAYINHRKNVEVEINIDNFNYDPIGVMKLNVAYTYAVNWFQNNGGTLNWMNA